ncbi:MAG: flagellar protein FlaG [Pseudomonadota bacterium]|nr:flagellar protein FlaG [Pseudomonadota bacterium]
MLIASIDGLAPAPPPARESVGVSPGKVHDVNVSAATTAASPPPESVHHAVTQANEALRSLSQAVEFEYDTTSRTTVIRLIDMQDQKVLRQIPTPEMLEIARALERMQTMLVRGRA